MEKLVGILITSVLLGFFAFGTYWACFLGHMAYNIYKDPNITFVWNEKGPGLAIKLPASRP